MENFTKIHFTTNTLDNYHVRTSIFNALKEHLGYFKSTFLDVGCGKMPYKEYILANSNITKYVGLDIEQANIYDVRIKPDFTWDGVKMPFDDFSFSSVIATEVLEHCPSPKIILDEVYRVLEKGGCFFFTVPFLWNLHEVPHDEYRYTPFSLERHLKASGFLNVKISAMGGWHSSMAQMLGLWVCRSNMGKKKRKVLKLFLKPIIRKLLRLDQGVDVKFREGQMITGLYGIAFKE